MSEYTTGTVSVTNGSAIVTGSGTSWTAGSPPNARVGDDFVRIGDGVTYKVASVDSDTQLTLAINYAGATGSGLSYAIVQNLQAAPGDTSGNRVGSGPKGDQGDAANVSVSGTTVVLPNVNPSVSEGGTSLNRTLQFSIPRAPTVAAGTTTTGAAGSNAAVAEVDSNGDKTFNFTIPRGDKGDTGIPGESGLPLDATTRTSAFTALVGFMYKIDTSGGAFTATMPASPSEGDRVGFKDVGHALGAINLTLDRNGSNFDGFAENCILNYTRGSFEFAFTTDTGWVLTHVAISGPDGPQGSSVLNGTGAPSASLGEDGEFYIDTSAWNIYGPKTSGAWGSATSLIGPAGPTGPTGPQGPQGDAGVGYMVLGATQTGVFTAAANTLYPCDTSGGAFTAFLPATPAAGDVCGFMDSGESFDTNNLTIGRNTKNIHAVAQSVTVDVKLLTTIWRYIDATEGWRLEATT